MRFFYFRLTQVESEKQTRFERFTHDTNRWLMHLALDQVCCRKIESTQIQIETQPAFETHRHTNNNKQQRTLCKSLVWCVCVADDFSQRSKQEIFLFGTNGRQTKGELKQHEEQQSQNHYLG